ncbi:MAG: fatty acid desaturase family protein [Jatrophihabitans sp.]|uniref:fatty acid desaturase family protein n=1 Tax=Jatrophihabitans sp. TaxID=1932789 RepID=UPI003F819552
MIRPSASGDTSVLDEVLGVTPGRGPSDGVALHDTGRTGSDRRAVRRSLVPPDIRALVRAQRMTRADSARAAVHCAVLVLAWVTLTVAGELVDSLWLWVPVWVAQAFLLHGAYSAMHDAAHGTLFAGRRANRVATFLWAVPLGINANLWRCWHLEHHRATATPDDPEPTGEITNLLLYVVAFPATGLLMFGQFTWDSLRALVGRPPGYADRAGVRGLVRRDAVWMVCFTAGIVVAAVFKGQALLSCWVIPLALYWCVVSLIFGLPEHYGTDRSGTQIEVTRTVATNRLLAFVVWNSNRHTAHHLVPTVHYRYLPMVDEALGDRVPYRARSYTAYHAGLVRSVVRRDAPRS